MVYWMNHFDHDRFRWLAVFWDTQKVFWCNLVWNGWMIRLPQMKTHEKINITSYSQADEIILCRSWIWIWITFLGNSQSYFYLFDIQHTDTAAIGNNCVYININISYWHPNCLYVYATLHSKRHCIWLWWLRRYAA